jgi:hypothetical protein
MQALSEFWFDHDAQRGVVRLRNVTFLGGSQRNIAYSVWGDANGVLLMSIMASEGPCKSLSCSFKRNLKKACKQVQPRSEFWAVEAWPRGVVDLPMSCFED